MVEFATPVWTSGLNQAESNQIERVQKAAFAIILDTKYTSYARALANLNRTSLSTRRTELNLNFANKCLAVQARTKTFLKSPVAYLTRLINEQHSK
jgi:hypothetical protein